MIVLWYRSGRNDTGWRYAAPLLGAIAQVVRHSFLQGAGILHQVPQVLIAVGSLSEREGSKISTSVIRTKGVDLNAQNINGETPLHFAAMGGNAEVVKILAKGSNVDLTTKYFDILSPVISTPDRTRYYMIQGWRNCAALRVQVWARGRCSVSHLGSSC